MTPTVSMSDDIPTRRPAPGKRLRGLEGGRESYGLLSRFAGTTAGFRAVNPGTICESVSGVRRVVVVERRTNHDVVDPDTPIETIIIVYIRRPVRIPCSSTEMRTASLVVAESPHEFADTPVSSSSTATGISSRG
jgi:hypothetical protein